MPLKTRSMTKASLQNTEVPEKKSVKKMTKTSIRNTGVTEKKSVNRSMARAPIQNKEVRTLKNKVKSLEKKHLVLKDRKTPIYKITYEHPGPGRRYTLEVLKHPDIGIQIDDDEDNDIENQVETLENTVKNLENEIENLKALSYPHPIWQIHFKTKISPDGSSIRSCRTCRGKGTRCVRDYSDNRCLDCDGTGIHGWDNDQTVYGCDDEDEY